MKTIKEHSQHIDNGGVILSIVDKGYKDGGITLIMEAQYFGYPCVKSEICIGTLGSEWLEKVGLMFIAASEEIKKIDFEKRYNGEKAEV